MAGLLVSLFYFSACQTPPQTQALLLSPPPISESHIIEDVPFYPQQQYFCGPTTLSEVANYYGAALNPSDIAPLTFVPGLDGSLQIEMLAASRQLGFVAYSERGNLALLLNLLEQNIPVIVLQNNSIALFPQWHYAVAIGYDLTSQEIVLHSGVTQNHRLKLATFERTWQRGDYWILAMLPPDKTSAHLQPLNYVRACQDLLDTGQKSQGIAALESALKQWPDYWLTYLLLANYYLEKNPATAVKWYQLGFEYGQDKVSYLNNYAYALSQLQCYDKAKQVIRQALQIDAEQANLLDTKQQILRDAALNSKKRCQLE